MNAGIDVNNLDVSVAPGDNFYDFASAGWRRRNPLTPEYSRFGAFDKLGLQVMEQVRDLITDIAGKWHTKGALEQKIALLYNESMDYEKRNRDGIVPVAMDLKEIDGIENMAEYLGRAQKIGIGFWSNSIGVDMMDSEHYIFGVGQGGIGLSRDYLLDDDDKSREIRKKYQKYMKDLFNMFAISDAPASKVYELEIEMAKSFYPKEKLRDPRANYHKMSYADFKKKFHGFDWDVYFKAFGMTPDFIDVSQIEPVAKSLEILRSKDKGVLRAFLKWQISNGAMTALGDNQYDLNFDFYGRALSGKEERRPKWKDAVALVESTLGEAVGQMYVKKYFPKSAKKRMLNLVENLRRAYADRIQNLDWMGDETKKKALEKLAAFRVKIGYPDKWRDYSKLEIIGDSLYADLKRSDIFEWDFMLEKLRNRKVDRSLWYMNPQTVNAYYDPSQNEICFPAGILQPPFFDMNADDAFNYGAIGSVIGHEMTHGFDDMGRHFDKDGNMKNWWTDVDAKAFLERAAVMKNFFNNIEVAPGVKANGEFTLGENLADYGGITIAFDAYKKYGEAAANGSEWTPEQRFFIAYAGCETGNIRPEEVVKRTKTDEHSLAEWRVNGILPHIGAWYGAFDVKSGDKMWLSQEKRCRLW
ncbi:MAG: M13 family metallopeptidase [Rickettsiales bacterium]|jgi:putative endopeptidase|nr:M13 family metallopeptidase [Rickettsiales bacterium]